MNYPEATQWGGRVGRYAETSGAVGRCRDPFAGRPVEFEFAFEYEAWLLARFSAATAAITHRRTPVTATAKARELKALATFVVTDRHGRQEYHLASRCEPSGATRVDVAWNWRPHPASFSPPWRLRRQGREVVFEMRQRVSEQLLQRFLRRYAHCRLHSVGVGVSL